MGTSHGPAELRWSPDWLTRSVQPPVMWVEGAHLDRVFGAEVVTAAEYVLLDPRAGLADFVWPVPVAIRGDERLYLRPRTTSVDAL